MANELTTVRDHDMQRTPAAGGFDVPPARNEATMRIVVAAFAIAVALISFFALGSHFTNPETYRATIEALDEKKATVMSLMGASTGSSAAISLLPGDAGT